MKIPDAPMRNPAQASPLLQRVREIAGAQLAPLAEKIDREGYYPREIMQALGAAGAYRALMAPPRGNGDFASSILAMAEVSSVCMSTGFLMWCQNVCGLYIEQSGNVALIERALDKHISGETLGGTGLSNPMKTFSGIESMLLKAQRVSGGYPVAVLAFNAGQPITVVGASTDGGFGIVAAAKSEIKSLADLKGKRVAVQPASTVETLFRIRLKETGLGQADVQMVRLLFQDMPGALARGDVDAFVGVEPGPSISISNGAGRVIDLPYKTPAGGLNLVLVSHPAFVEKDPDTISAFLRTHRRAVELAKANPAAYVDAAVARLGIARPLAELAVKNIDVQWRITEKWLNRARFFNETMVEVKQIKQPPDMAKFVNTVLNGAIAKEK